MGKCNTELVIGMDVSNKKSEICILDADGEVKSRSKVDNTIDGLELFFKQFPNPSQVLVAMETGTHSPWMSSCLSQMNFKVLVGNSRKLRAIWASENKTDKRDAEMLARIARFDKKLFYPIRHRSKASQASLAVLKAREALVKSRTLLINSVRGMLKSMGISISSCSTRSFAAKVLEELPEEYLFALNDTVEMIANLSKKIDAYDAKIDKLCQKRFPETKKISAITGVGPITALAFVLIIENPDNFRKSRDMGPFLGLTPKRDQSGEVDKALGISKTGNDMLRRLLVQCAQYILGPFGPDCELRRYGENIISKGGGSKKKAMIAVARKLSVLMHKLWLTDAAYDPFYNTHKSETKQEAA